MPVKKICPMPQLRSNLFSVVVCSELRNAKYVSSQIKKDVLKNSLTDRIP